MKYTDFMTDQKHEHHDILIFHIENQNIFIHSSFKIFAGFT